MTWLTVVALLAPLIAFAVHLVARHAPARHRPVPREPRTFLVDLSDRCDDDLDRRDPR